MRENLNLHRKRRGRRDETGVFPPDNPHCLASFAFFGKNARVREELWMSKSSVARKHLIKEEMMTKSARVEWALHKHDRTAKVLIFRREKARSRKFAADSVRVQRFAAKSSDASRALRAYNFSSALCNEAQTYLHFLRVLVTSFHYNTLSFSHCYEKTNPFFLKHSKKCSRMINICSSIAERLFYGYNTLSAFSFLFCSHEGQKKLPKITYIE